MNIDELVKHLKTEIEARELNWLAEKIGNLVFIYGPRRNKISSDNLAIVSFFQTPPLLEITKEGKSSEDIISAMWEKYLTDHKYRQPKGGPGKGILSDTYSTVTIIVIGAISFLCLIAIAGGLYLGSIIF